MTNILGGHPRESADPVTTGLATYREARCCVFSEYCIPAFAGMTGW